MFDGSWLANIEQDSRLGNPAHEMGATHGTVSRWVRAHRRCLQETSGYARIIADITKRAIGITHRRT